MTSGKAKIDTLHSVRRTAGRGFTLIETLVVLVVLLVGILAIVRLFPPGFLSLGRTQDMTMAQSLGQQQIDDLKNAFSVPDSAVAVDPITNQIVSNVQPDNLTDFAVNDPALGGNDPYYYSNANHYNRIIAETFHVPVPSSNTGGGTGSIYALMYGPVRDAFGNLPDSPIVRGAPMQRTEQTYAPNSNNLLSTATLVNEAQYAIDMTNPASPLIAFYPRVGTSLRQFVVTYSYYSNATGAVTVVSPVAPITLTVPDVAAPVAGAVNYPVWQHLYQNASDAVPSDTPAPVGLVGVKPESDDVSRKFKLMSTTAGAFSAWDANDPYEYVWYSPQVTVSNATPSVTNATVGVMAFNPVGYNQISVLSRGTQGITARVDYSIFDNHIIRDDRVVPAAGPYTVSLSLPFVYSSGTGAANTGDVLDINASFNNFNTALNPYNGIFRVPGTITPDLLIYNMNTGAELGEWTNGVGSGILAAGPTNATPLDNKTGQMVLNDAYIQSNALQGATIRCFYRAHKDWAEQVQKASSHYGIASAPALVDYQTCYVSQSSDPFPTRIYFAMCDMGKTVVLGQYYANVPGGVNSYTNEEYQIANNPALFDSVGLPYIDVTQYALDPVHQTITGFNPTGTGELVQNIQGVSVKSRIIWRSVGIWRHQDADTFISPPSDH